MLSCFRTNVPLFPLNRLQEIADALNQNNLTLADQRITQFQQDWRYPNLSDTEAQTLYEAEIGHKRDAILSRFQSYLGTTNGQTLYNALQNTREMASLLSLAYNAETLIGGYLTTAMWNGNRAEAWFEIRYNSNNGSDLSMRPGLAKRRYLESQMFGLYDNPASVGPTESQQIYKMLQNHRAEIVTYEKNYGVPVDGTNPLHLNRIAAANNDFSGLLQYVQSGTVQTIEQSLNPAKDALFTYLQGRTDLPDIGNKLNNIVSTNIYLAADPNQSSTLDSSKYETGAYINGANDLMIGTDQTDTIYGRKGADVLIGEGGNDKLFGNEGNDVLYGGVGIDVLDGGADTDTMIGGADDDTYIVDNTEDVVTEAANEGTDTVKSSATFTLRDNVEDLTLMGTDNIDGTGNDLANDITGNTGNNKLDGGGNKDTLLIALAKTIYNCKRRNLTLVDFETFTRAA